jgi:hypothetical protein
VQPGRLSMIFQRNKFLLFRIEESLKMEAVYSSVMSVMIYQTSQHYIPEKSTFEINKTKKGYLQKVQNVRNMTKN